jgi:hypothetical protein
MTVEHGLRARYPSVNLVSMGIDFVFFDLINATPYVSRSIQRVEGHTVHGGTVGEQTARSQNLIFSDFRASS